MCKLLGVTRGGYYAWQRREPSARSLSDAELSEHVREVHAQSRGYYGSPRVTGRLRMLGVPVGRRRVARLMRQGSLQGRSARLYRRSKVGQRRLGTSILIALFAGIVAVYLLPPSWLAPLPTCVAICVAIFAIIVR